MSLLDSHAKICLTAAGILIHKNRVLLVKHKKLGLWLNPGGHIELDESPHQAAVREFWEETGLKVQAVSQSVPPKVSGTTEFLPNPVATNLHWVSQENYQLRQADPEHYQPAAKWKRGCEQHSNQAFVVELIGTDDKYSKNDVESDDIRWFTLAEIKDNPEITPQVKYEIELAFNTLKH